MAPAPPTPRRLVLDLLRVTAPRPVPVRALVAIGALFDLSGNAMRVAVTRLVADELLEHDERGSYRLARRSAPLTMHVEQWREGEARRRAWDGRWWCVHLPRGADRVDRRKSLRALALLGFREGLEGMFVRPANLRAGLATFDALRGLGLEAGAEPFVGSGFSAASEQRLRTTLWDLRGLAASYREALDALVRSTARLAALPLDRALVETFLVGGAAIRVLATDPLLPDEILDGRIRAELGRAMTRYDVVGRRTWARRIEREAGLTERVA